MAGMGGPQRQSNLELSRGIHPAAAPYFSLSLRYDVVSKTVVYMVEEVTPRIYICSVPF